MEEQQEQCATGVVIDEFGLIEDILRRVPIKSLVRLQFVSKQWRSLISDPAFLRRHASATGISVLWKHARISRSPRQFGHHDNFSLCTIDGNGEHGFLSLDSMNRPDVTFKPAIFGSCNGLLLIRSAESEFALWNPFTKSSRRITGFCPDMLRNAKILSGLAYDRASEDYKAVVVLFPDKGRGGAHPLIFSYRRNSWTNSDTGGFPLPYWPSGAFSSGPTVNGCPHWVVTDSVFDDSKLLVCFDAVKEDLKEVPLLPDMLRREDHFEVGMLDGCLSIVVMSSVRNSREVRVWLMKQYGVAKSWTNVHILKVPCGTNFLRPVGYLTCRGLGGMVMEKDVKQVVEFNVRNNIHTRKTIAHYDDPNERTTVYVESIVSPWGL
ncbi:hypothetical protein CDL15_Pgr004181 [Punica granatum]|nr:hypothetical protein CDL15_Pgr004181 [Punica granatum]